MTQSRDERRPHQLTRDGQVGAAVEFDEDNKAKIALAKTATFEDLVEALAVVDLGTQQIIDEAMPQALEMIEAGAPIDTPADRQRLLERARANQQHQEDHAVVQRRRTPRRFRARRLTQARRQSCSTSTASTPGTSPPLRRSMRTRSTSARRPSAASSTLATVTTTLIRPPRAGALRRARPGSRPTHTVRRRCRLRRAPSAAQAPRRLLPAGSASLPHRSCIAKQDLSGLGRPRFSARRFVVAGCPMPTVVLAWPLMSRSLALLSPLDLPERVKPDWYLMDFGRNTGTDSAGYAVRSQSERASGG